MRKITLLIVALVIQHAVSAQVNCAFTASTLSGCPPLNVSFQDQSTGATSYYWEFDNSNTSTLTNPATTYNDAGIYNVLHIASNGSQSDTEYLQIRVFNPPSVNFFSPNPTGCNSPCHLVNFANQTIPGESAVQSGNYVWDFGHGLPDTGYNATHCYPLTGSFTVTLIARDDNGCQVSKTVANYVTIVPGPVSNASASPTQTCASSLSVNFSGTGSSPNGAVTYGWDFGNGTSTQQNPVHTFNCGVFNSVLSVTDAIGCVARDNVQIDVPCLSAGFTSASTNGCTGIPVQFTDTSNFASSWSWDFGDGGTSTLENPTHTYTSTGNYTVILTISYAGCTATETK
ncbi:MAG: PKD domain-containing protein, partial [Bacteroidota bacterium]